MSTKLTIIQQNDTHGQIEPHLELFRGFLTPSYRMVGGFARISNVVKRIRKQYDNVLFIDSGDLFHGTGPLVLSKGEVMPRLLNKMTLDAFVPGNWEYAYGPKQLISLVDQLNFPAIAANVSQASKQNSLFLPYIIKEFNKFKVGIIGLTYPYVDKTMPDSFSEGLSFSLGISELPNLLHTLRSDEHVDLIIVNSHLGLPLDVKLASMINGIDVILSGHSHDRIEQPINQNGCIIIQSGSSGSFLGKLDLEIGNGKVKSFDHQLIPLFAEEFAEDPDVVDLIDHIMAPYHDLLSEPVGNLKTPIHRMALNEAPMDRLITNAYLHNIDADVAFSHGWRYGAPVLSGTITVKDLYNIIPTNPELFLLEINGADLLQSLENNLEQVFSSDAFQQKGGYVLRSSNLMMAYKPYNPVHHRIQHIEINGKPLLKNKTYRIVGGGGQILKEHHQGRKLLGISAHAALKNYFSSQAIINVNDEQRIICI